MSSALALGNRPIDLVVVLAHDSPFVTKMVRSEDWADGTSIALEFRATAAGAPTVWEATIVGDTALWDRSAAEADAVLDAGKMLARLVYTPPAGSELTWGRGTVAVDE